MNRPFFAFGALLMLLAMAMLSVSSATRCTTVAATDTGPAGAHSAPRGAVYVVVLPAADDEAAGDLATDSDDRSLGEASDDAAPADDSAFVFDACAVELTSRQTPAPTYATGCGLDRMTGIIYGCEPCWASEEQYVSLRAMTPARIAVAEDNTASLPKAVDCRSHHDPAYDRIVYGPAPRSQRAAALPIVMWSEVEGAELVKLFHGLAGTGTLAPAAAPRGSDWLDAALERGASAWRLSDQLQPYGSWDEHYRQLRNLRTMYLGLKNYVAGKLSHYGWLRDDLAAQTGRAIDWNDYADLLDSRAGTKSSVAADAAVEATSPRTVRSSRWLLHSAASVLNHAGEWMQATAVELERAGSRLEARHTGALAR